jgi:enoyl-[acyl-carrier-protein] reductase (NADH)
MAESEWTMPKGDLMRGKKGLVMGVANQNSIAWGIASQLAAQGAEMAFTYMGEGLERRVRPLAEQAGVDTLIPCDVTDDASMDQAFKALEDKFGALDFVVHSIAFADKNELKGSFVDNTTREGFLLAMNVSAYSFVDVSRRAAKLMPNGGSIVTMTYLGSERVIPNYNTMGVAKAALEAAMRYAARDLGPKGPRPAEDPRQRHLRRGHAHPVAGRHLRRAEHDRPGPHLLGAEAGHLDGGGRGLRPVAVVRPRPIDHRRGRARGRRLPHDGHARSGGGGLKHDRFRRNRLSALEPCRQGNPELFPVHPDREKLKALHPNRVEAFGLA